LSMIPPWREALAHALDAVAPGGSLEIVDFSDCAGLPRLFKAGLPQWLTVFDATPRDDLAAALEALAAERDMSCEIASRFRGYAIQAAARRKG
jgi:S-adenosylmethionine-diacylgycerolhomoserine-N-methlytransferase